MQKSKLKKNRAQNLPKGWRRVKLGGLLSEVVSGSRPKGGALGVSHGVPSIGAEHLNDNGGFDFSKIKYIPEDYYRESTRGRIKLNDILCVKDGATIGKVSRVTKNFPFQNAMVNEHVFIVRSKPNLLDQVFLFYKLRTHEGKEVIKSNIGGSAQGGLKKDFLNHWEIILPPLDEQKRIASILSAFDDKIELNNKISKNLEEMAQAIFKEWFVNFKFPGHEKVKMVDSELGKIPEGWEMKKFVDFMEFLSGRKPPESIFGKNGKYHIYGSNTIMGKTDDYLYKEPLIVLARIGSNCGAIRYSDSPCWISNNTTGIRGKAAVPTLFVYLLLQKFNFEQIKEGTGQPYISIPALKIQKAIIPPQGLLNEFDKVANSIYKKIKLITEENQKLAELRDLLLPKLMSGEIRV